MSSTISVSEYDALYDGFCRVRAERDAAIARADRLRDALILACNATDGFASLEVSDEFLLAVPGEVAKRIGRLLTRATEAEAAHEDAMRGVLHTLELLNAAETRAEAAEAQVAKLREALIAVPAGVFRYGDRVRKKSGSSWQGRVCGTYRTALTPEGYCIESEREPGSVQIYPGNALELVEPADG